MQGCPQYSGNIWIYIWKYIGNRIWILNNMIIGFVWNEVYLPVMAIEWPLNNRGTWWSTTGSWGGQFSVKPIHITGVLSIFAVIWYTMFNFGNKLAWWRSKIIQSLTRDIQVSTHMAIQKWSGARWKSCWHTCRNSAKRLEPGRW